MRKKLLSLAILGALTYACGNTDSHDSNQGADENSTEMAADVKVDEVADFKFHSMLANLPSPLQTFQTLRNVELTQKSISLTPTSVAANLSTNSAKAYGYGIFMTDMGFMAYQHQNQQSLEYMHSCRTLANDLGAGDVFDQTITQKFEESSTEEIMFVKMMDEAFTQMDAYMLNNERFINATEIFVGSWVESQIIATKLLQGEGQNESNKTVWEGIYNQKLHASNLVNVLGEVEGQINMDIYNAVEDIMMFYAGFSDAASITQDDLKELQTKLETLKSKLLA